MMKLDMWIRMKPEIGLGIVLYDIQRMNDDKFGYKRQFLGFTSLILIYRSEKLQFLYWTASFMNLKKQH